MPTPEKISEDLVQETVEPADPTGAVTLALCGCGTHSQCDHEWGGWREIDGGRGGEQFCQKCGMGAMHHSLMNDDW